MVCHNLVSRHMIHGNMYTLSSPNMPTVNLLTRVRLNSTYAFPILIHLWYIKRQKNNNWVGRFGSGCFLCLM